MSSVFLENVVERRPAVWLPAGDPDFDATLMKSLADGIAEIVKLVGSHDARDWRWGETIPVFFRHPLSGSLPLLGRLFDVGPFPQAGIKTTVKQTTSTLGPSMRMVIDFSNFDDSVQNITLGESGQPLSTHYKDQIDAWYTGGSFPMPFSNPAVEKATTHKLVLEPKGGT